jgi:hypothetical protein
VSSPLLARYDSSKKCFFLKTDWFANTFGYYMILLSMQPDDSPESMAALEHLLRTAGECKFDLTLKSACRLHPIRFSSRRRCAPIQSNITTPSLVAKPLLASIGPSVKTGSNLWGSAFYWLCDCSGVKEILEYDGPIHQVHRWAGSGTFRLLLPCCAPTGMDDGRRRCIHPSIRPIDHHLLGNRLCYGHCQPHPAARRCL